MSGKEKAEYLVKIIFLCLFSVGALFGGIWTLIALHFKVLAIVFFVGMGLIGGGGAGFLAGLMIREFVRNLKTPPGETIILEPKK